MRLLTDTFNGLANNSKVDFVLWTGDSSRHDRDSHIKKQRIETYEQNVISVSLFMSAFDVKITPVIPSIGNWDVFPNANLAATPNDPQLTSLWSVWEPLFLGSIDVEFEEAKNSFLAGGYFSRNVLDGLVTVISINSLLFFSENPLVTDCRAFELLSKGERHLHLNHAPNAHLVWIENQLLSARASNRKVIIQGHVGPEGNGVQQYNPECFEWFVYFLGEYSDVILSTYFGHINRDLIHLITRRNPPKKARPKKSLHNNISNHFYMSPPEISSGVINPFRITTMLPTVIPSFDIKHWQIVAAAYTGSSIVPAFNPGYRIGTLEFVKQPDTTSNQWTIKLVKHVTAYLDLTTANKNGDTNALKYKQSCSTLDDFGMVELSPDELTAWLTQMQSAFKREIWKSKPKNKKGAQIFRKYTKCIDTSYISSGKLPTKHRYFQVLQFGEENFSFFSFGIQVFGVALFAILAIAFLRNLLAKRQQKNISHPKIKSLD
ncbi:Endopolyphosphatase [Physocladia obscura]|uniref:Endopolyphosphatase n=1 Tax=Physocladia obscura TaxID=109957 RepID=A0AAD5T4G2_9FUNG|nr:Endopolyphosphatase [Physocladia obscura]